MLEEIMLGIARKKIGGCGVFKSPILERIWPLASFSFLPKNYSTAAKEMTVHDALNSALDEEMATDTKVLIMGEEAGFGGIGVGAAYYGLRPVVEFMTVNFSLQAIDHIVNSAAKSNYMSAGQISVPIVFRGPNGSAAGVAAQHSHAAELLSKEGISAEVVNLRSIRPLDRATINASVQKTSRLVTVEEAFPQHGVGAEICASVVEESFDYLDAPVETVSNADVPVPYAINLERMSGPQVEDIVRAVKRACYRSVPSAHA